MSLPRILVVEDNPLNMKLVRDVLQFTGYEVLEATTGEDGVDRARGSAPDLVLLDLQLPGIDGIEVLRLLRGDERTRTIPVVAVTAFAMRADRERAGQEGFDGYLTKPISIRELPAEVDRFIRGSSDA